MKTVLQRLEQEREESRRRTAEKDKLLSKRAAQINTLHGEKMTKISPNHNTPTTVLYSEKDKKM